jgi:glycerophosphoryl diester phosphodiesterase
LVPFDCHAGWAFTRPPRFLPAGSFAGASALFLVIAALWGNVTIPAAQAFELQGHRGARGLMPENTLAGFAKALSIGVTTLELDVGVSSDGVVVVAHDKRLNGAIARDAEGTWLSGVGAPVNHLSFAELRTYDVGRLNPAHRYARRFAGQHPVDGATMPSLAEVIRLARKAGNERVRFNIETKLNPAEPGITPAPKAFARAVIAVLEAEGVAGRAIIQSFDWRTLGHVQRIAPGIATAYLSAQRNWLDNIETGRPGPSPWTAGLDADDFGGSVPRMVKAAGGKIWSPYRRDIDAAKLKEAHDLGLEVVVWTVNNPAEMAAFIDLGVDGIITDYPDRLRRVAGDKGIVLPAPTPVTP